ncbi:hypothetical protein GCM10009673_09250 [Nesterenkonia sandarakina]
MATGGVIESGAPLPLQRLSGAPEFDFDPFVALSPVHLGQDKCLCSPVPRPEQSNEQRYCTTDRSMVNRDPVQE